MLRRIFVATRTVRNVPPTSNAPTSAAPGTNWWPQGFPIPTAEMELGLDDISSVDPDDWQYIVDDLAAAKQQGRPGQA